MKNFNTLRWVGTIILFPVLYILLGSVLSYLLTGDFKNVGSEMKYGVGTWILLLQPSAISANPGWEGVTVLFGIAALIGVIILFTFSYWVMGKIFKNRNIQKQSF